MALKMVKSKKEPEKAAKKKLKVVATEPEIDPEEPDEPEEEEDEPPKVAKVVPKSKSEAKRLAATEKKKEKPLSAPKVSMAQKVANAKPEVATKPVKAKPVKAEVIDSKGLIEEARVTYRAFQVSWFDFAKKLKEIRDCEAWTAAGHDDFTSLCREEFPNIPPSTISKFIKVVEEFGTAIEARSKTTKALPAYDALYEVAVSEKKIPKEEGMRLRKAVVECKISLREVRDVVRGLSSKKPTKHAEGRSEKKKARHEEIGIKPETDDAEVTDEDVEVDEKEEITSSVDKDADVLLKLVRQLLDKLPSVTESMSEGTAKLIELAEAVEEVQVPMNEFLDRLESVSNL